MNNVLKSDVTNSMAKVKAPKVKVPKVKAPKVKVPLRFGKCRKLLDEELHRYYWKYIEDLEAGFLDENIYKSRLDKDEGPKEYWRSYIYNAKSAFEEYFPYSVEDFVKIFVAGDKVPAKLIEVIVQYASTENCMWKIHMEEFLEDAESTLDQLYGPDEDEDEDEDEE